MKQKQQKQQSHSKINIIVLSVITVLFVSAAVISLRNNFVNNRLKGDLLSSAGATTYKDWSQLTNIDNSYSYSTLIYTDKTKFYINGASDSVEIFYRNKIENGTKIFDDGAAAPLLRFHNQGEHVQVIITNCAINGSKELINAVFDLSVENVWGDNHYGIFSFLPIPINNGTQSNPNFYTEGVTWNPVTYNSPLSFQLDAHGATIRTNLTYYTSLDLKNADEDRYNTLYPNGGDPGLYFGYAELGSGKAVDTSINNVNSYFNDMDVVPNSLDETKPFSGKEGIMMLSGTSTAYYNKTGNKSFTVADIDNPSETHNFTIELGESNNGLYTNVNGLVALNTTENRYNLNGIWYAQDAEFLTTGANGTLGFAYSGSSCGIVFMFFSPKGYDITDPVKKVSNSTPKVNEEFNFTVEQYVPNNYYGKVVNYSSMFDNMSNGLIEKLSFYDEINPKLTINQSGIDIVDSTGKSLKQYYSIDVTNNVVRADLTSEGALYFKGTPSIYNNTIKLVVPSSYKQVLEKKEVIPNVARVIIKTTNVTSEVPKQTNEVTVTLSPIKLIYDCVTNGGKPQFDKDTYLMNGGEDVDVTRAKHMCKKENNKFLGWAVKSTDTEVLTKFTMPYQDTILYAIYEPLNCDTIITSKVYSIDTKNHIINVPNGVSTTEIKGNIQSKGELTVNDETVTVVCGDETVVYKISRYWIAKTGQNVIKYSLIIGGILGVLALLFILARKKK